MGNRLAQKVGLPVVDLRGDALPAASALPPNPSSDLGLELRAQRRNREEWTRIADAVAEGGPRIILAPDSLGPCRHRRLDVLDQAVVVHLQVSAEELFRRLSRGRDRHLGAASAEDIAAVLDARTLADAESHGTFVNEGVTPEAVAEHIRDFWARDPVAVAAGAQSYAVEFQAGALENRVPALVQGARSIALITDENVDALHAGKVENCLIRSGLPVTKVVLPPGERSKVARSLVRIWRTLLESEADRGLWVVAVGGGVITDLSGFAAATWMRGVPWVGIPTTLLAMVDASVGGKTGIDLQTAKNAVGAFWQPRAVMCDVDVLRTEPERGYVGALAEVVKTALIGDPVLFEMLENNTEDVRARSPELVRQIVRRSVQVKAGVVSRDERESGLRALLNLGHTVGHALEAQGKYEALSHGEAVSLGLVAAVRIGEVLGVTPPELGRRVTALLGALGLPIDLSPYDLDEAARLVGHDKKRRGASVRFIVARGVGAVEAMELPLARLRELTLQLR